MIPIKNPIPPIGPGMKIKLKAGQPTTLGRCTKQYDWTNFVEVDHLEDNIIIFKNFETVNWYTTDMTWERA